MGVISASGSKALKTIALLMLMASLSACARYRNYGYIPPEDDLAAITVGVDTRASVTEAVGSPTAGGVLNESGYYYLSARTKTVGPAEPEFVDRQLVAISFDRAGVVSNVERFTLRDGNVVALSRRVTDSNIKGVSFLRQLMGSLGRVSAAQFAD